MLSDILRVLLGIGLTALLEMGCQKEVAVPIRMNSPVDSGKLSAVTGGYIGRNPSETNWKDCAKVVGAKKCGNILLKPSLGHVLYANGVYFYSHGSVKMAQIKDNGLKRDLQTYFGNEAINFRKVYDQGANLNGWKVELHYFINLRTGKVFEVKTVWGVNDYQKSPSYWATYNRYLGESRN